MSAACLAAIALSLAACSASDPPSVSGISGQVTVQERPVVGASVQVQSLSAATPPAPDMAVLTDQDGRFFWPLPVGRYRLTVRSEETRHQTEVVVEAGKLSEVVIELTP